jgi:TRAP-type C4-dicarboxylate transport system substrate-binding protein
MREMRAAGDEVKAKTAGRVELKFFPGGVMGNGETVLRKIKLGQLNGGAFAATELTGINADAAVYGLPFIFDDVAEVRRVRERLDPMIKAGFEQKGMVVAGITGGGFIYMMSTKPIATQAQMRSTKVWVPEGDVIGRIAFEEAGISPVQLALGDVYTSLQTGLIETVGNTTTGAVAFQWTTKLKVMVDLPVSYTIGILALDKKALGRLSAEDQAAVVSSIDAAFARLETSNAADDLATRETLRNEGIEIIAPDAAEAQAWRDVGTRTLARMGNDGLLSPQILDALKQAKSAAPSP